MDMSISHLVLGLVVLTGGPTTEPEPQDTDSDTDPVPSTPPGPELPWTPEVVQLTPGSATVERISTVSTASAAPLAPADIVAVQGDEVHRFDPFGMGGVFAYDVAPVLAVAAWGATDDALLIATTEGLVSWDGGLVDNDYDALVDGVTDVLALPSGLWMDTADGLRVVRDDDLLTVAIEGVAARGFARGAAGDANQIPVVWTAADDRVVAVNFTDDGLVPFEVKTLFGPVDDIAATATGRVFAIAEGWLVERRAENVWVRLDIGEAARELAGNTGGDEVWVRTDTQWIHIGADGFTATDVPVGLTGSLANARADAHGRLITSAEAGPDAGVSRWAVGRPLLLLDVPTDNVLTATDIRVVPTAPDLAPTLTLEATAVTGEVVDLPVEDFVATLDPEVLTPGPWTLEATADYGSEVSTQTATIVMGADFVPTWPDHIEPIYQSQCTPCHAGDQGIIGLATESDWVQYIDVGSDPDSAGILERVLNDNMPSDTRVLTDTEKFLVSAWRDTL
jgi:hypothetical protein